MGLGKSIKKLFKMEFEEIKSVKTLAIECCKEENYKYEILITGDLLLKYQGMKVIIDNDERDPLYLRMYTLSSIDSEIDKIKLLKALADVSALKKLLKGSYDEGTVCLAVETFIDKNSNLESFSEIFNRCLVILGDGFVRFSSKIFE